MGLRTCTVSYCDLKGVQHVIEVTADSLYEAVAQGLRVFRENDWIDEVGRGQTIITFEMADYLVKTVKRLAEEAAARNTAHETAPSF